LEKVEAIFSTRLRLRMQNLHISQTRLARITGIQPAMIMRYLRGTASPNLRNLWRLCKALDCPCDYLLGNSEYCFTADSLINAMK